MIKVVRYTTPQKTLGEVLDRGRTILVEYNGRLGITSPNSVNSGLQLFDGGWITARSAPITVLPSGSTVNLEQERGPWGADGV